MVKFIAMLDPPSAHSYGMVPFLVEVDGLDAPVIVGQASGNMLLDLQPDPSVETLISDGHARAVPRVKKTLGFRKKINFL